MKSKTGYFLVNTLTGKKNKYSTKKKAIEARKKLDTVKYKQTQKQTQKQHVIINVNAPAPKTKSSGYVRKQPLIVQGGPRMIQAGPTAMDLAYSAKVLNDREPPKTGLLESNKQNYEPIVNDLFLKLMEQQKSKPDEPKNFSMVYEEEREEKEEKPMMTKNRVSQLLKDGGNFYGKKYNSKSISQLNVTELNQYYNTL
jgi:hypothetical protein